MNIHFEESVVAIAAKFKAKNKRIAELEKFKAEFSPLAAYLARECCTTDGDLLTRFKHYLKAHNLEQQQLAVTRFANANLLGDRTIDYQVRLSGEASLYVKYLEALKEQGE